MSYAQVASISRNLLAFLLGHLLCLILQSMNGQELLEDSLEEPPIGYSRGFEWYVTPIGIAALSTTPDSFDAEQMYPEAIKEGLEIGLELTKEEREFHSCAKGTVIIFYS